MITLLTKIRGYGWFCSYCNSHKNINDVSVVKIVDDTHIIIACVKCHTELVDCFLLDNHPGCCDDCTDKFKCFTRADYTVEQKMLSGRSHEFKASSINAKALKNIQGVRSYTGIYNDKLDSEFCIYKDREDCNHSWMRSNYSGKRYSRCSQMQYDLKNKIWFCAYGVSMRGNNVT